MNKMIGAAFAASLLFSTSVATAGEIKGPPPGANLPDAPRLSSGNSFCSYSGLNDTPEGQGNPGEPEYDPGGQTQSYGSFLTAGLFDPSDPAQREGFAFPGVGCNPQHSIGLNPKSNH